MKMILEIVKALNLYQGQNTLKVVGKVNSAPTQISKFYSEIKSGKIDSDEKAAELILGCQPNDQVYKDLKSKLKNRIINTLFFIDPKKFNVDSTHNKNAIHCHKRWIAAKILLGIGAKESGIELAKRVLAQAVRVELSGLIVEITVVLRFQDGAILGDKKKFNHYNALYHKHGKIRTWEDRAQEYYLELALIYVKKKADKSDIHEKAKLYFQELEPYIHEFKTSKLSYYGGMIELITYMSVNDFKTSIEVCKRTLNLLTENPMSSTKGITSFMLQQLICCIQLKLFKEGEELAIKSLALLKPGIFNWFKHQELYFLLSTYTKNYQRAYEVIQQTLNTRGLNALDQNSREIWRIYNMYTKYLIIQGKIETKEEKSKSLRLGKFLNELPTFAQDKRGLNIAILIIQILIYIKRKDYDQAINRMEAIEKYCSRYLKPDNNFRSNCFIKMLLQIPDARFHSVAASRKATKLYEKLKSHPIDIANQAHSIEIIPYEDLWTIVIESLGNSRVAASLIGKP